ncbi:nucleoside hydrolase [Larkinella rosea]|uniref:Nucleoside hydrolase n=1 Tax=Larkinella rosea TaxID=2025312 RepID=A0A3P1BUP3_9BACT|nr:nucleoside hydrolase [Larkinella rosea]RRB04831.1 nucleoside hydrolase [Larkinella rosea]
MKSILTLILVAATLVSTAQKSPEKPVSIILDTDIGPDYDDVGAMAVLHALADKGEARPLAVIASNQHELVVPTIDVLNTYFGRPNLPTGVTKGPGVVDPAWQKWPEMLVATYPHKIRSSNEAPDAVAVYRQILAKQPNGSVTIVTVGFLSNIANLLDSKPDRYSKLDGKALVKQKVKELVSMAGAFPKGREFNVYKDSVASEKAFANWPTPVIFSGFEIGKQIKTGPRLVANQDLKSPVKDVFALCMPKAKQDNDGRMSWDQTAVLVAIRGVEPYYGLKRGRFVINGGSNSWQDDPNGSHYYLTEKMPVAQVTEEIESLMMHQPGQK